MSDIYDLDTNQQVIETLPPDKRYTKTVKWLQACLKSTVQWLRDRLLNDYRNGSSAAMYAAGTYSYGDFVQYERAIYVSLIDNNTDLPTVTNSWYKTQGSFIGLNERILYNGITLTLTFALNKWFNTTFRQPAAGLSDIYLVTNPQHASPFLVGGDNNNSSLVYADRSIELITDETNFTTIPNMTVMIPLATYNSLGDNNTTRTNIVRSFTDQYITAGIIYDVQTY
jgi:hypothetical protein